MAHKTRIGKCKWRVVVEIPGEKRERAVRIVNGLEGEAEEVLHRLAHEVASGEYIDSRDITVGDWLEKWLARKKDDIAQSTYESYYYTIDAHLSKELGSMKIQELRPHHIQEYYDRKKKSLSGRTVQLHHTVLKAALDMAERLEVVRRNPAASLKSPKKNKPNHTFLQPAQVHQIIEKSREHSYADGYNYMTGLLKVAVHTGLRKGELLALKWDKVDLEEQTISVHRVMQADRTIVDRTKNESSRRTISVNNTVTGVFGQNKKEQAENRLLLPNSVFQDNNLVFCCKDGRPLNYNYIYVLFARFAKSVGVDATFHDLRHTHASLLHQSGDVDLKDIQDRLGHSNYSTTADIYAKADTTSREVAEKMEDIL